MGCCNSANPDQESIEIEEIEDFVNPYMHIGCDFYEVELVTKATKDFSQDLIIGHGSFGDVYECEIDGIKVAVKRLSKDSAQGIPEFENELNFISGMDHANVIKLVGYSVSRDEKILIYEYMNKSLESLLLDSDRRMQLDWLQRVAIIKGIADGLSYLHDATVNLIHRDIKSANILLDNNMVPKISDFGTARKVDAGNPSSPPKGTVGYWDPLYFGYTYLSTKTDVYSFGVVILEMLTGRKRLTDDNEHISTTVWRNCIDGDWLSLQDSSLQGNTPPMQDFLRVVNIGMLCVQNDLSARPSSRDLVEMLSSMLPLPSVSAPHGVAPGTLPSFQFP